MNNHWEAQTVLESLTWLSQNLTGLDTETAEIILVSEGPWAIVLDYSKAKLSGPQGGSAPAPAPLSQASAESLPAATLERPAMNIPSHTTSVPSFPATLRPIWDTSPGESEPPRKLAGM